jgi:hypothetical protein
MIDSIRRVLRRTALVEGAPFPSVFAMALQTQYFLVMPRPAVSEHCFAIAEVIQ